MKIIDLGCGRSKVPGTIGIDMDPESDADIILDIDKEPIPLEDNSVDKVRSSQFFEHLEDPFRVLREIYRILRPGGEIFIEVPHYTSHIAHGFGHRQYYSHKELVRMLTYEISCEIVKAEITFYKSFRMAGIHYLANKFPTNYERFWAYILPAENIKITGRVKKDVRAEKGK